MSLNSVAGRWNTGSWRRGLALTIAGMIAALTMVIAAPAQAHEPYTADAWGSNQYGQLGIGANGPEQCGTEFSSCSTTPVNVKGLRGVTAVAGGGAHALALLEAGTVAAWGDNSSGQLGNGTETNRKVPVAVKELSGVTAIAGGRDHSLALLSGGTVMAWGQGAFGQLGNGTETNSDVPVAVKALSGVTAIAAGRSHSLALLSGGTVMAWGSNTSGELGNGTTTRSNVPVEVKGLKSVVGIAAGTEFSLALLSDGTVMAWGANGYGQLGIGSEENHSVPVAVSGVTGVKAIAAGERHSVALLSNGTVMTWGENGSGQLGVGASPGPEVCGIPPTSACSKKPVSLTGLNGVRAVSTSSGAFTLALLENGTLVAWGANEEGQLGVGTATGPENCPSPCSKQPVAVHNVVDAKGIAAGREFSLAFGPPPTVTNMEPNSGKEGKETSVTITGTDFTGATAVKFGSTNAVSFTVNSATSITAVSPAEPAGKVDVTVTNEWGVSATSPADQFTYVAPGPPPTIKRLSPKKGPAGGGTSVTIRGTNFTWVTAVKFGSTNATSFTVNSAKSITAVSPAGMKGKVAVTVTTPNGTSSTSRKDQFNYT